MYIEFSITSDVTTGFKYMTTQMKTDRYVQNIYPFSKFRGVIPENWPLFFISRIHASHYRNTLFCEKGTSMVSAVVGSRGCRSTTQPLSNVLSPVDVARNIFRVI